jgi:hypothetical protein
LPVAPLRLFPKNLIGSLPGPAAEVGGFVA